MSTQLASVVAFVGDREALAMPEPEGARVIVVGSGKGGVGTSTVTALLALVAAARGERVLLVDASDGHGVQHLLLGVTDDRPHLRSESTQPGRRPIAVTPRLSLLHPGAQVGPERSSTHRRVEARRNAELYGQFDLVVVDGGSRLDSVLAACEAGTSLLLTVTTADRICLAATYALIKAVGARLGERPLAILGNRVDEGEAREAAQLIASATDQFLRQSVTLAGNLPDDACLSAGIAAGMSIQDAAADSPAALAMRSVGSTLLNPVTPSPSRSGNRHLLRSR